MRNPGSHGYRRSETAAACQGADSVCLGAQLGTQGRDGAIHRGEALSLFIDQLLVVLNPVLVALVCDVPDLADLGLPEAQFFFGVFAGIGHHLVGGAQPVFQPLDPILCVGLLRLSGRQQLLLVEQL